MVFNSDQKALRLEGPLSMYPPAEDNYGTDACCVLCLPTRPPTIVIATAEGMLHHCCLLDQRGDSPVDVSD